MESPSCSSSSNNSIVTYNILSRKYSSWLNSIPTPFHSSQPASSKPATHPPLLFGQQTIYFIYKVIKIFPCIHMYIQVTWSAKSVGLAIRILCAHTQSLSWARTDASRARALLINDDRTRDLNQNLSFIQICVHIFKYYYIGVRAHSSSNNNQVRDDDDHVLQICTNWWQSRVQGKWTILITICVWIGGSRAPTREYTPSSILRSAGSIKILYTRCAYCVPRLEILLTHRSWKLKRSIDFRPEEWISRTVAK